MLGTAKTRQETSPPERADELADVVLPDADGGEVRLGDLWRDRPAVLVFLRHYGWVFCREHAVQLHRDREKFEAAGVELALIGQGTPEQGAAFKRAQKLDVRLLVDGDRRTHRLAGAKKATFNELLGPVVLAKGIVRSLRGGHVQGRTIGHPAVLGGVMVIATDGTVTWTHMADDASDNAPNAAVLEAAREAAQRG